MNEDLFRLMELSQNGLCCSQMLVQMGLEAQGRQNPDLVRAMGGLCRGMGTGTKTCGALSGGLCLLSLYFDRSAAPPLEPELSDEILAQYVIWFDAEYGDKHEGTNCLQLLDQNWANRSKLCPSLVLACYRKVVELLNGAEIPLNGRVGES